MIFLKGNDIMFELRQLKQLIALSEYGTLSEAAEKLFITQPALSRSMQKLENELGIPLFVHNKKNRISLNQNGELAVTYAKMLLTQASDIEEKLRLFNRTQNTISIGSCAPAPIWKLMPFLTNHHPDITISYEIHADSEFLIKSLLKRLFKLIITPYPIELNNICSKQYFNESLYLTVPAAHELAVYNEVYLRDLENLTTILSTNIGFWYDLCKNKMVNPNFILMEKFEDYEKLVNTTILPCFITDIDDGRFIEKGWHMIHILDEEANVTYYCSSLEQYKEYIPDSIL